MLFLNIGFLNGGVCLKLMRQKKIVEIIRNGNISTQDELAEALKDAGYDVTQATVSRDIKELRLIKIARADNTYVYGLPKDQNPLHRIDRLRMMMHELVTGVDYSENIVVIKTYPGNAQGIASLIDSSEWPGVIGTLAGDDTIFLVIKPIEEVQNIMQKINEIME
jgi:transcriptional regulator of arginine metabolism